MTGCVAVFDVGKTNIKLVVFDADGGIVADRSHPNGPLSPDAEFPYLRLDTELAWRFLMGALREVGAAHPIEAISVTTHGASGVLVAGDGVALPPMDYEFDGFGGVDAAYDAVRPPFAETLSTLSARGLNLGRQIFYLERTFPDRFAAARAFLACPQYWSWRLSGVMATEVTSLGAHTDLWRPKEGRLSSLVETQGWTRLFPPIRRAWETLGALRPEVAAATGLSSDVRVVCGAHDSNASLVPYLAAREDPFTVLSTGTWVIIMAVGGKAPIFEKADMLANVDIRGRPVPTARLMLGREFAVLAGETPAEAGEADVAALIASGAMALPAFTDQGGPFARRKGEILGPAPQTSASRSALATLYCALVSAHMLERLQAPGDIIVEGGFNRSPAFASLLAALCRDRAVFMAPASGAAEGAALLAQWDRPHASPRLRPAERWSLPGLQAYHERWRAML